MADEKKIVTLIGFANKAGKLVAGKQAVLHAISKNRAELVLLSSDVSHKTIDELHKIGSEWHRLTTISREELGRIVGRTELTIVAITDQRFAKSIRPLLD